MSDCTSVASYTFGLALTNVALDYQCGYKPWGMDCTGFDPVGTKGPDNDDAFRGRIPWGQCHCARVEGCSKCYL